MVESGAHSPAREARALPRSKTQKCKNPTGINPVGFLVLATSYSRTAYRRTTIGAAAFHCRVRNGNGWGHCAIVTRVRNRTGSLAAAAATQARGRFSGDGVRRGGRPTISLRGQRPRLQHIRKNMSFNRQSPIENPQFFWFSDIYIQDPPLPRLWRGKSKSYNARLCFVFEIICLLCVPSFAVANDGLTEKEMIKP